MLARKPHYFLIVINTLILLSYFLLLEIWLKKVSGGDIFLAISLSFFILVQIIVILLVFRKERKRMFKAYIGVGLGVKKSALIPA